MDFPMPMIEVNVVARRLHQITPTQSMAPLVRKSRNTLGSIEEILTERTPGSLAMWSRRPHH